jgi:hypothetical protein
MLLRSARFALCLFSFSAALCILTNTASSSDGTGICHHGACFAKQSVAGDVPLLFRSSATKRFWGFTVYDAGLYLSAGFKDPRKILEPVPKKLVLRYHRNISKDIIIRTVWHNLEKRPDVNLEALRSRVDQLHGKFQDVKVHDQYALVFVPGQGTELYFNGRLEIAIPGDDFQAAYFGIWLSNHPLNKKLRDHLLDFKDDQTAAR